MLSLRSLAALAALALPVSLLANAGGPPIMRTGAPADGGLNCTVCHSSLGPANSDPRGRVTIEAEPYRPGVKQILKVIVEHPDMIRWGFQLTARLVRDERQKAGTFTQTSTVRVRCSGGAPDGNCGNNLEFAVHNASSTQLNTPNRGMWEIEWTPPAANEGDVIFYAAGNASNGNNINVGDRIYTTNRLVSGPCELSTPRVTSVRNAASFAEGPVSLNTLISIGGSGFQPPGARRAVQPFDIENDRFPNALGCIAVEIGGRRAPLTFVNENQINAQVPSLVDLGPVEMRVIANPGTPNERRGDPTTIQLAEVTPAFFRFLPSSAIAATLAGLNQLVADPAQIQGARAARPGDAISLFATGLAATDPFFQAGEISFGLPRSTHPITVMWNNVILPGAAVRYIGLAPGTLSGLYQIDVVVPSAAGAGDNEVRLRVGSVMSPAGTTVFAAP